MVFSEGLSLCCPALLRIGELQARGCIFDKAPKHQNRHGAQHSVGSEVPTLALTLIPIGVLLDLILPAFLT